MRIILGLCLTALLAVVACSSSVVADTCQQAGGQCIEGANNTNCGETMPFDCGDSKFSCCRPK
jgi:hypothetical protein